MSSKEEAPQGPEGGGLLATIRAAIHGTSEDLTAIPVRRAVVLLAVPTILEMSMESLLTIVDIFFVSRLGSAAVATVGLTESMLSIIYAMAMGLSAGATAIIARRTGEKDPEGAAVAAVQVLAVALLFSLIFGLIGGLLAPELLAAMGASPEVIREGTGYTRMMLGGNVSIFLLFVINAIFRSVGDAAVAMRSLWLANLLNMALAPLFIFGWGPVPGMGVLGAAVAMTLCRAIGVAYQVAVLVRGRGLLAVAARHLVVQATVLRELLRISSTATLQVLVETASWLGLVRIVSSFGSSALAGYTIAMRIALFAILPSWGMAGAASTLVGQNLGAQRVDRARSVVSTIAGYNVIFLGLISLLFLAAPGWPVAFFTEDAAVIQSASSCLRIVAVGFLFFGYGMVVIQAFNGAGDTATPLGLNAICFWLIKIPLAYALARWAGLGPSGVFVAITIAYVLQALGGGWLFRRGSWQSITLPSAGP
ncbi:MAG: MATE family efflux transporter [Polyangiaceae bacterium]|jgi:putative MATE family efflux protein|nr:MATE family efflux transporter [Polyangiaceae bacterium]